MTTLTRNELLTLLIEECSEVIQAATKCLRFGYDIDHGLSYGNNKNVLSKEIGELLAVIKELPLNQPLLDDSMKRKMKRAEEAKARYGV